MSSSIIFTSTHHRNSGAKDGAQRSLQRCHGCAGSGSNLRFSGRFCAVWAILENQRSMEFIRVFQVYNFQISMDFSWFLPQALTLVTSYWYYLPLYHYALLPLCDSYIAISWLPFCLTFVTFQAKLIEELKVRSNADVLQAELKLIHGREKTMQLAAVKKITRMTPKRRIWSGLSLDATKSSMQ